VTQVISQTPAGTSLADTVRLGAVELRVTELERSIDFYTRIVGMQVAAREGRTATLHAGGEAIVTLREQPGARQPHREAGLYHFALLFPSREELARVGRRVAETRTRIDGASDHRTHEAIYLPDPDGIGVELAADRPREYWPRLDDGQFYSHGPQPLDVRALFATVEHEPASALADPALRVGHIHLHVGDLDASTRFYRDGLGFAVMAQMPHAVFVSVADYHHHVAYNLWRGGGVGPPPDDVVGLRHWTLVCADPAEREAVRQRLTALGVALEERSLAPSGAATPSAEAGTPPGGTHGMLARDPSGIAVLIR
jgi:catechol 2,3-dioxygenase